MTDMHWAELIVGFLLGIAVLKYVVGELWSSVMNLKDSMWVLNNGHVVRQTLRTRGYALIVGNQPKGYRLRIIQTNEVLPLALDAPTFRRHVEPLLDDPSKENWDRLVYAFTPSRFTS